MFASVHSGASKGRRVHSCSRELTWEYIGIAALIRFCLDSVRRASGSPSSFRFSCVHLGGHRCRRVHLRSLGRA